MQTSKVAHVSLLLALIGACFVAEAARHRVTVKKFRAKYKIDWWDNGRDDPYRVIYNKNGLKSDYRFDESGHLKTLKVGDETYAFSLDLKAGNGSPEVQSSPAGSRMLLASADEDVEGAPSDHRRLYDCTDCEETWDALCGIGIVDVCSVVESLPSIYNEDAQSSLTIMCNGLGVACDASAFDTCEGQCIQGPTPEPTPASTPSPVDSPDPQPHFTPAPVPTPGPVRYDTPGEIDACDPTPCQNGGSCALDPAGGHVCSCPSGYAGMSCHIDTSSAYPYFIEFDYVGPWTDAHKAVLRSAADRWSEVITHVPVGDDGLLITATLGEYDGARGVLARAGPRTVWPSASAICSAGYMTIDIADIETMVDNGSLEGIVLHGIGNVIGIGILWGNGLGECTTCRHDGNPNWTCPAARSAYFDIGGKGSAIIGMLTPSATSSGALVRCADLDHNIFVDELMTGSLHDTMYLSKITAAILEDLEYIVDPSAVDPYTLPSKRGGSLRAESVSSPMAVNQTTVDSIILAVDSDGNVVDEIAGVMIQFGLPE